jgi:hypothetical protein
MAWWRRDPDPDPWFLNGPEPGPWPDVPAPMVPGVQPWEAGEPVGEPAPDDWRRERFEEVNAVGWSHLTGWGEPAEPERLVRCPDCQGGGCGWCGHTGWVR